MRKIAPTRKLLSLLAATRDVIIALEAYERFKVAPQGSLEAEYTFANMVIAYARPFLKSHGLGATIKTEFPGYPDFTDKEMNVRHRRFIDIRNKFVAHSSTEGVAIIVHPRMDPVTGCAVSFSYALGRRTFLQPQFADWLVEVIFKFRERLDISLKTQMKIEFEKLGITEPFEIETGLTDFEWTKNMSAL